MDKYLKTIDGSVIIFSATFCNKTTKAPGWLPTITISFIKNGLKKVQTKIPVPFVDEKSAIDFAQSTFLNRLDS